MTPVLETELLSALDAAITAASEMLTARLGGPVGFTDPATSDSIPFTPDEEPVEVRANFTEGVEGWVALVVASADAARIAGDAEGSPDPSAPAEALGEFVDALFGSLGERLGRSLTLAPPQVAGTPSQPGDGGAVVTWTGMGPAAPGRLALILPASLVAVLESGIGSKTAGIADVGGLPPVPGADGVPVVPGPPENAGIPLSIPTTASSADLGRLADVQLDVSVELGRSRIPIRELLSLDEGGVIRLERPVGEPVDLLVNGLPTARGEIVIVDGRLGLKVTELIG